MYYTKKHNIEGDDIISYIKTFIQILLVDTDDPTNDSVSNNS